MTPDADGNVGFDSGFDVVDTVLLGHAINVPSIAIVRDSLPQGSVGYDSGYKDAVLLGDTAWVVRSSEEHSTLDAREDTSSSADSQSYGIWAAMYERGIPVVRDSLHHGSATWTQEGLVSPFTIRCQGRYNRN